MGRETIAAEALARSQWRDAAAEAFGAAWENEVAHAPPFRDSAFHMVTGLLLPIWNRLPDESLRVYRLQTDAGERVIGRLVSPATLAQVCENLGLGSAALSAEQAWSAVIENGATLHMAGGVTVRRALVMGRHRAELAGFSEGAVEQLKALGLTSEIISWKLRLFIPVDSPRSCDPRIGAGAPPAPPLRPRRPQRGVRTNREHDHGQPRCGAGAPSRA